MNLILKQVLIIGSAFFIILWFQSIDDKRNKRERTTYYEQFKFPVLVSAIVGFVLNLPDILNINKPNETPVISSEMDKPFIPKNNFGPNVEKGRWFTDKDITDQQVFTDLADF